MKINRERIFLYFFILAIIISSVLMLSKYHSLPGPLYGGDVYVYYGHLNHMYEGGNVFDSPQFLGEKPHLPWLYYLFPTAFGKLVGVSSFAASTFFPLFILILSALLMFWIGKEMFDEKIGLVLSVFYLALTYNPYTSSSVFSISVGIPLVFSAYYLKDKKYGLYIVGGLYGLSALIDLVTFLHFSLFFALLVFVELINSFFKIKKSKFVMKKPKAALKDFWPKLKPYLIIAAIGIPISFLFLWSPIIHYGMQMPNPFTEYVASGTSNAAVWSGTFATFKGVFFNFNSLRNIIFSLLAITGLVYVFKEKKPLPIYAVFVLLVGYAHPLITKSLFGMSFAHYSFAKSGSFVKVMMVLCGAIFLLDFASKKFKQKKVIEYGIYIFLVLALVLFLNMFSAFDEKQWVEVAMNEGIKPVFEFADRVKGMTDVNDVVLTFHPESGFAINSLTGLKVVNYRRTHASPYVDMNKRNADSAVMLWGENNDTRDKLLQEYAVKYIYADQYSAGANQGCLQVWEQLETNPEASYNCFRTSVDYEDYLAQNGLETKRVTARLDPASNSAPTYEILAIKPKEVKIQAQNIDSIQSSQGPTHVFGRLV